MDQLALMVRTSFVREEHGAAVLVASDPGALLESLRNFDPPRVHKLVGH
ncbi:MAG TPA: hypothetical protein VGH27_17995 [Streptosporangiaceae bacterium]|jgi:hypothetical protein